MPDMTDPAQLNVKNLFDRLGNVDNVLKRLGNYDPVQGAAIAYDGTEIDTGDTWFGKKVYSKGYDWSGTATTTFQIDAINNITPIDMRCVWNGNYQTPYSVNTVVISMIYNPGLGVRITVTGTTVNTIAAIILYTKN